MSSASRDPDPAEATVSIVIPTFNRADLLPRCIESALAQTVPCEIVVCDHGSTDATPSVAEGFGDAITYIRRERDHGPHFCWLEGMLSATGKFLHFTYDDDLIRPTFVEECLALMDDDVGLCFTMAEVVDIASGDVLSVAFGEFGTTGTIPSRRFLEYQLVGLVSPTAVLLRREDALDQMYVGAVPFSRHAYHGVGPDWLMTSMTARRYPKVGFVAKPLAVFGSHEGSISVHSESDPELHRRIGLAYAEARRFFMLAEFISVFRVDRAARFYFWLRRVIKRVPGALRRRVGRWVFRGPR